MKDVLEEYIEKIGDPIPLAQVMGNKILVEQFHENAYEVYEYCLRHNKTWEEVLEVEPFGELPEHVY